MVVVEINRPELYAPWWRTLCLWLCGKWIKMISLVRIANKLAPYVARMTKPIIPKHQRFNNE